MSKINQISRMAAPNSWPIERKGVKWVAKPYPGTHSLQYSMALNTWLLEILELAKIRKNIKRIISAKNVLVNGKPVSEEKFPLGIFDVLSIPKLKKNYRVTLNKIGKLMLVEIPEQDAKLVPAKIISQKTINGGKTQFNCSNGWNILHERSDYKIGDVLLFDAATRKVAKHLGLKPGSAVFSIGGKHVGQVAKLKEIKEIGELKRKKIAVLSEDKETWETSLDKIFVIGEGGKQEIKVQ